MLRVWAQSHLKLFVKNVCNSNVVIWGEINSSETHAFSVIFWVTVLVITPFAPFTTIVGTHLVEVYTITTMLCHMLKSDVLSPDKGIYVRSIYYLRKRLRKKTSK